MTYTVAVTFTNRETITYTNSTGAEPRLSFLIIGFEDHTVIIPENQIQVVTIKENKGRSND